MLHAVHPVRCSYSVIPLIVCKLAGGGGSPGASLALMTRPRSPCEAVKGGVKADYAAPNFQKDSGLASAGVF